jgi:RNA polymerase sigma-70 factor, ECF subfamily
MTGDANAKREKARRFHDAALPYLDDVLATARYLMRDTADAEDAVQDCYLRALRYFDTYRGPVIRPWLLEILRNVCSAEFARRAKHELSGGSRDNVAMDQPLMWHESPTSPEAALIRRHEDDTMRRLVAALPQPFREAIVLREINELSYQEIAQVAGVPIGTVMSRLARARSLLRSAWKLAEAPSGLTRPQPEGTEGAAHKSRTRKALRRGQPCFRTASVCKVVMNMSRRANAAAGVVQRRAG